MDRQLLVKELKKFFDVRELVCQHTFAKFGEKSWQFFDHDFLETLLIVRRDILKRPMTVNRWHIDGTFPQRGFRCNICPLVKSKTLKNLIYLTSHANGAGLDWDTKGLTVAETHQLIRENSELLPVNVRMEAGVTWNHMDIYDNGLKYSEFDS